MNSNNRQALRDSGIQVLSTCPSSAREPRDGYAQRVINAARWSEEVGCTGMLVYTDNSEVDPWLVAQIILQNTSSLCPLVAVQPIYMHPYAVAKMVSSFAHLYGRRIYLNMVAGGFKNDLIALNDTTAHDRRYDRLIEYTSIIQLLVGNREPQSFSGEFYTIDKLKLTPPVPEELRPSIFMSGSSEAGLAAARRLGATAVMYPKPVKEYEGQPVEPDLLSGVRLGIISRDGEDEAWRVAHDRFPEDRKGQLTHQLAMKVSDSVWHRQLSELGEQSASDPNPYWLIPFQNYKTMCPYLVGGYDRVAAELRRYIAIGHKKFILDIPPNQEELGHIGQTFLRAIQQVNA